MYYSLYAFLAIIVIIIIIIIIIIGCCCYCYIQLRQAAIIKRALIGLSYVARAGQII